jgi:hypothetical protein
MIILVVQYTTFTRKLVQLLDIDDDSLLNVSPLATIPSADRYVALQQRQRTIEILLQKIEVRQNLLFLLPMQIVVDVT